jgi:hypothetical protein
MASLEVVEGLTIRRLMIPTKARGANTVISP